MLLTWGYSQYQRNQILQMTQIADRPILHKLPDVAVSDLLTKKQIVLRKLLDENDKGLFVHFWATWCGPCEVELPSFIKFAKSYEKEGVKFLLLAVNDDEKKIKKFLKKVKNRPNNIILAHDEKGVTMAQFGTVQLPETYLFAPSFINLFKFIGPQEWGNKAHRKVKELLSQFSF